MKNQTAAHEPTPTIDGVMIRPVKTFADDRGYFRELWRGDTPGFPKHIAQTAITLSHPGVIKAFHGHAKQDDCWYVAKGSARVVLLDKRKDSNTYGTIQTIFCGEDVPVQIFIPRGVFHGYQVLGKMPVMLVYQVTRAYNAKNPDELRIPWDDASIAYDWSIKNR